MQVSFKLNKLKKDLFVLSFSPQEKQTFKLTDESWGINRWTNAHNYYNTLSFIIWFPPISHLKEQKKRKTPI